MRGWMQDERVNIVASREEISQLANVVLDWATTMSRAEFYIRTGCSVPNIKRLEQLIRGISRGKIEAFGMDIVPGVEEEENPRRPRPRA